MVVPPRPALPRSRASWRGRLAWLGVFLGCCVAFSATADAGEVRREIEQRVASAKAARDIFELERAESHYRLALERGHRLLAELSLEAGDLEAAEKSFEDAVTLAPSRAVESRLGLAALRAASGREEEALRDLRLLVRADRDHGEARRLLVRILALAGELDAASAELSELASLAPELARATSAELEALRSDPGAEAALRTALTEPGGEPRSAERIAESVREIEGINRENLERLETTRAASPGEMARLELERESQGELREESAARAALDADPRDSDARRALALHALRAGRSGEAEEHVRQAAELGPLDRPMALWLAEVERRDRRLAASNRQYRSLVERFVSTAAEAGLARNLAELGNHKLAADHARKALREAPLAESVLRLYASTHLDAKLAPAAAPSVETLARMRPESADYAFMVGRVWTQLGDMGEGVEALSKAVALDAELAPARRALGLALAHEQRFEAAREHLEWSLERDADDLEVQAALAETEERLGDVEAAEARVRGILEGAPAHPRANLVLGMLLRRQERFAEARDALEKAVADTAAPPRAHYQLSQVCARLGDRDCAAEHLAAYRAGLESSDSALRHAQPVTVLERKGGGERR